MIIGMYCTERKKKKIQNCKKKKKWLRIFSKWNCSKKKKNKENRNVELFEKKMIKNFLEKKKLLKNIILIKVN